MFGTIVEPAHLQVLSALESRFGLRVGAEGLGFEIEPWPAPIHSPYNLRHRRLQ